MTEAVVKIQFNNTKVFQWLEPKGEYRNTYSEVPETRTEVLEWLNETCGPQYVHDRDEKNITWYESTLINTYRKSEWGGFSIRAVEKHFNFGHADHAILFKLTWA